MQSGAAVTRFSTDALAPRDRFPMWREVFARTLLNVEIEAVSQESFSAHATIRTLPGIGLMTASISAVRYRRTAELIRSDDILFSFGAAEGSYARQRGREASAKAGDALIMLGAERAAVGRPSRGTLNGLRLPRAAILALEPNVEDGFCRRIPGHLPALQLLAHYVRLLGDADPPELQQSAARHILDLVGLVLRETRGVIVREGPPGLRAARLEMIKEHVGKSLGDDTLSINRIAARHGLTPRYIQRLFEEAGLTFTGFVLEQRLTRAHRMLADPAGAGQTVTEIALTVGFNDLSYFNRTFRRRFGASPSDIRVQACSGPS